MRRRSRCSSCCPAASAGSLQAVGLICWKGRLVDVTLDVTRHVRLTGGCRADREQWLADNITPVFNVPCHQRLRGPYTGVDTILAAFLPEAARRWPDLVEQHRFELLYGIPELAEIIGS